MVPCSGYKRAPLPHFGPDFRRPKAKMSLTDIQPPLTVQKVFFDYIEGTTTIEWKSGEVSIYRHICYFDHNNFVRVFGRMAEEISVKMLTNHCTFINIINNFVIGMEYPSPCLAHAIQLSLHILPPSDGVSVWDHELHRQKTTAEFLKIKSFTGSEVELKKLTSKGYVPEIVNIVDEPCVDKIRYQDKPDPGIFDTMSDFEPSESDQSESEEDMELDDSDDTDSCDSWGDRKQPTNQCIELDESYSRKGQIDYIRVDHGPSGLPVTAGILLPCPEL